jgi:3-oxoacyl-[acyl-carrier-protein] synthase-3
LKYSRLVGTGRALPRNLVTNEELAHTLDTSDQWIVERTGIRTRYLAGPDENATTLGEEAARQALETSGWAPEDLDLIIMGTTSSELMFPNSAVLLQARLGIPGVPAFSVEAVCSGFLYALSVADQFIRSGQAGRVLVVGAETFTRYVDPNDRSTCILFGDGAGAVLLEAADEPGIMVTRLHADGRFADLLYFPSGPGRNFRAMQNDYLIMQGSRVFKVAVQKLGEVLEETLRAAGVTKEQINWLVPHQANLRIIEALAQRLELPMSRVVVTVDQHANTSSASVPLALDIAIRDGRIQRGDLLMLEAFGGGFTWGAALIRY